MELTKNLTQAKLFKSLVVIVLGSIALTISAKIKIPFYPVPMTCLLYTSPSPRDYAASRMPSSA